MLLLMSNTPTDVKRKKKKNSKSNLYQCERPISKYSSRCVDYVGIHIEKTFWGGPTREMLVIPLKQLTSNPSL